MENRYDKYKDSGIAWIREIPEHWEVKRMKSIYNFGKGLNITKADLVDKGIPVISYGQIHSKLNTGTCIKDSLIKYVPEIFFENNNTSLVKKGDIIFADTSEDLEGCGNCIYIDRDMLLYAGYHTIIAKNISTYINKYFSYLFQTDCWRTQIRRTVNGVKLFSIPQRLLASTDIITPSTQEQQSIATYLDQKCSEIDELITLQEEMITKLQSYKQSVIKWIGEIPEHWKVVKIKYLAKIKSGDSISSNELIQAGIYEVYGGNGLMGYCNKNNVNGFNIIIGRVGALCGNVRLISDSKFITDNALILNCFDNALYPYMYIMLKAANLNNLNTSNAQPLITGSKVLNVSLPIPPLSEQQSIANYLDQKCSEIDELISIKQQKIEKLKDYKKSLIFECVTGKRKV